MWIYESAPPPPGILLGTRGKLSKLRTVENLQRGAAGAAVELRHAGERVSSDGADVKSVCNCVSV